MKKSVPKRRRSSDHRDMMSSGKLGWRTRISRIATCLLHGLRGIVAPTGIFVGGIISAISLCGQDSRTSPNFLFLVGPERIALESPLEITTSGVRDGSGQDYCWSKIVGASFDSADQAVFNQTKDRVGDLVYQLDLHLRRGDYRPLADVVGRFDSIVYPADSIQHGRIILANLQTLLHTHHEEEAVVKWGALIRLPVSQQLIDDYPSASITAAELDRGLHRRLLPVFFDQPAARRAHREITELWQREGIRGWGEHVYTAALLIAIDEFEEAESQIQTWPIDVQPELKEWAVVLRAHAEVRGNIPAREGVIALENQLSQLNPQARLLGRYVLALEGTRRARGDRQYRDALLEWLEITAETEKAYPGMAAASLAAAQSLALSQNWAFEARRIGTELRNRFPRTYHGRQLQAEQ